MTEQTRPTQNPESSPILKIRDQAIQVIKAPADFFAGMPKSGGFTDPLIFAVLLGVIAGAVRAVLSLAHLGAVASIGGALAMIVITPIFVVIGSFIGGAVLFFIWRLMGSQEPYETAFRCGAYMSAIAPITAVIDVVPFLGGVIGIAWMTYLLVNASVGSHGLDSGKAWKVFGIIGILFALMSVSSEAAGRKVKKTVGEWQQSTGGKAPEEMTAEDAGRAAAAFMKAMQEAAEKQAEEDSEAPQP